MIDVVLADDHAIVRDGLRRVLHETGEMRVAGEAGDGVEVMRVLGEVPRCVLVLDLNMPGCRGLDTIAQVRAQFPGVKIVVFSMYEENSYAVSAMRAGAGAFLSKARAPAELVEAIRKVDAGGVHVTPRLAEHMVRHGIDLTGEPHEALSSRELEIFRRLAAGRTPTAIADELGLARSTVTTYVHRIKQKLGVETIGEVVRYAHRHHLVE